jgi:integrase
MGRHRASGNKLPEHLYFRKGQYWVRIWVDGKDTWKAAGKDLKQAKEVLREAETDAERGRLGLPKRPKAITLLAFEPDYLKWAKAHKESWERDQLSLKHLLPTFGPLNLSQINKARVEAYMRDRKAEVTGPTVNREVACLRKVLSYAVELGHLETNPLSRVQMFPESPARQPVLTPDDERRLLKASPEWLRWVIRLAIATGCRRGELLALRWRHVDIDNAAIIIENSKSGDSRRVPIHRDLVEDLKAKRGAPEGFVIMREDGTQPHKDWIAHKFEKVVMKLKLKLRYHDLRHVAGTRLLTTGANLPEVATFLGHKTLTMARRYAHTNWSRLQSLVSQVPVQNVTGPVEIEKEEDAEKGKVVPIARVRAGSQRKRSA